MSSPITYCFCSSLKPLMLRLIRVSSCNSSSFTLLSLISLWFRRFACIMLASVCSVFNSLAPPSFLSRCGFRHRSSQCLLCCPHCRLRCLLLAPRYSLVAEGRLLCFTPFLALLRRFLFSGCTSYAFSSVFFSLLCTYLSFF